jgi:hypothetical protein
VTTVVLAAVVATGNGWLLLAQALVFAIGAADLARAPYGVVFRRVVRPRIGPPRELEPAAPPRFAQLVGLVFAAAGTVGYLAGAPTLGTTMAALALVAAFLNAAFGLCLGCEAHLLIARLRHRPRSVTPHRSGAPRPDTTPSQSATESRPAAPAATSAP